MNKYNRKLMCALASAQWDERDSGTLDRNGRPTRKCGMCSEAQTSAEMTSHQNDKQTENIKQRSKTET